MQKFVGQSLTKQFELMGLSSFELKIDEESTLVISRFDNHMF